MTRVDIKQGVLQAGPGKLGKWVHSCQRSSEAGYIVLERVCSVFKRPHKTMTVLPLLRSLLKAERNMSYQGREHPSHFLSFVNPVVTIMSSHQIFLWSPLNSFNYILQTFSSLFFFFLLLLSSFSSLGFRFPLNSFLFPLPTSKPWTGITGTFPDSSWRTPVCAWVLAVYASIC